MALSEREIDRASAQRELQLGFRRYGFARYKNIHPARRFIQLTAETLRLPEEESGRFADSILTWEPNIAGNPINELTSNLLADMIEFLGDAVEWRTMLRGGELADKLNTLRVVETIRNYLLATASGIMPDDPRILTRGFSTCIPPKMNEAERITKTFLLAQNFQTSAAMRHPLGTTVPLEKHELYLGTTACTFTCIQAAETEKALSVISTTAINLATMHDDIGLFRYNHPHIAYLALERAILLLSPIFPDVQAAIDRTIGPIPHNLAERIASGDSMVMNIYGQSVDEAMDTSDMEEPENISLFN